MKKLLLITIALLGIIFTANAQTGRCNIANGNGATVNVTVVDWNKDGTVELSIDSDSVFPVNITFTLCYYYEFNGKYVGGSCKTSQPFSTTAQPGQSNTKTVRIRLHSGETLYSINAVNVEGARCIK